MINNFEYYSPTKVIFGKGTEKDTWKYIKEFGGSRVMIVHDNNPAAAGGLLDTVKESLSSNDIPFVLLDGIVPNPHLDKIYEGIELGKKENTDFLLAIGGGSVIDTAKAIAYGLAEPDKDVWELHDMKRRAEKCLPVGSIVTIAAAGSELSKGCVVTNEKTGQKRGYNDNLARPKFAIMNPEFTETLPDYQTQSGCVDIMMHTLERYFTNMGNMELTDSIAEGLLRNVIKNAHILHADPKNYDARAEIMWSGALSQNDLTGCGNGGDDWMSHKIEHELGGMFDVTHGAGLAAVWPAWAKYVYKNCLPRFKKYAVNVMGVKDEGTDEEIALKGIQAMEEFFRSVNMPTNMKELGISPTEDQIKELAKRCKEAAGPLKGAAMHLEISDMENIYRMAL